ncbi:hypothetical protein EDC05_004641 [Coemansia umbellata]|nr:hypothetical protein EDC05_004641 [Coemansia umbellata]
MAASATGAKKPNRRAKNKSGKAVKAATAKDSESAAIASTKGAIAARLGAGAAATKVIGKGRLAGRVGKSQKVPKAEANGRLAGMADRKKGVELKKKLAKTGQQNVKISIKGEAGPATIFISNLDTEASAEDVKSCFKQFGTVKNCTLLYDHNGRASGHAEITYAAKAAAEEAVAKLNNALADGRTLTVRLVSASKKGAPQTASFANNSPASSLHKKNRKYNKRSTSGRMDID